MHLVEQSHLERYQQKPQIITSAPGVVRLLGVLSNINQGTLLQGAINREAVIALSLRQDDQLYCYSVEEDDLKNVSVKNLKNKKDDRWFNLIKGVVAEYKKQGFKMPGMNITLSSNILPEIGLSSSAAIAVALAKAISTLLKLDIEKLQIAQTAYLAEYRFMNKKSVLIADSLCSLLAKENHLFCFDMIKMEYRFYPIKEDSIHFYMVNSNVPIQLEQDEKELREQYIQSISEMMDDKEINRLEKLESYELKQAMSSLSEMSRRFCTHILGENKRIIEATKALEENRLDLIGNIMKRSQESLRDNYETSCPEIDWLVKRAVEVKGVFGARLIGHGFGGSIVVVIAPNEMEDYQANYDEYERIFGFKADYYRIHFSSGSQVLFLESESSIESE